MKIENGSKYQETEIVSYVQVINKAEIDRYLQRGKRKVCDGAHGVEGWVGGGGGGEGEGGCSSQKIRKGKREGKKQKAEKQKGGKLERV